MLPSNTPVSSGDPFVGRIKFGSVPPPRTARTVKRCIAKKEIIKDRENTSLFLTSYSQTPMDDTDKVSILNGTGPGSTSQEPLALVAKLSDSERSDLESGMRGGLVNAAEAGIAPPEIRYGTSIQQCPFLFVTLDCLGKCTTNSTPMTLKCHRK